MYGTEMPLNQLASISVPEPQQLAIRPYDQKLVVSHRKGSLEV